MRTLLLLLTLLAPAARAGTDPFNTYQWNPEHRHRWFEWWYYKVVDAASGEAFYFTYGVVNPWDLERKKGASRAVLQAGSFADRAALQEESSPRNFSASFERTDVRIGSNHATDRHIEGELADAGGEKMRWSLDFRKDWGFNAMGWATGVRGLSGIYWYPAQASARVNGSVSYRGKTIHFRDAPGYQDRNWGRSFPRWWTWLAANNFHNSPGTVLAAGGGKPKAFNFAYLFSGLMIGLRHQGREYAFRTTDGHQVRFNIRWGRWEVAAENFRGERIEISAYAPRERFLPLLFRTPKGETFYDYNTLLGRIEVRLYHRVGDRWKRIARLETDAGGIEWGTPEPIDFHSLFQLQRTLE